MSESAMMRKSSMPPTLSVIIHNSNPERVPNAGPRAGPDKKMGRRAQCLSLFHTVAESNYLLDSRDITNCSLMSDSEIDEPPSTAVFTTLRFEAMSE